MESNQQALSFILKELKQLEKLKTLDRIMESLERTKLDLKEALLEIEFESQGSKSGGIGRETYDF